MQGTIERFNRSGGEGVILAEDGREFVFNVASLQGIAVEDVRLGLRVRFEPRSQDSTTDPVIIFEMQDAAQPASSQAAEKETTVPSDQVQPPSVKYGDAVTKSSWDSFPASDAPANSGIT